VVGDQSGTVTAKFLLTNQFFIGSPWNSPTCEEAIIDCYAETTLRKPYFIGLDPHSILLDRHDFDCQR
jgi:hypothetical protein